MNHVNIKFIYSQMNNIDSYVNRKSIGEINHIKQILVKCVEKI